MTPRKGLVLDANILLRAVFGQHQTYVFTRRENTFPTFPRAAGSM